MGRPNCGAATGLRAYNLQEEKNNNVSMVNDTGRGGWITHDNYVLIWYFVRLFHSLGFKEGLVSCEEKSWRTDAAVLRCQSNHSHGLPVAVPFVPSAPCLLFTMYCCNSARLYLNVLLQNWYHVANYGCVRRQQNTLVLLCCQHYWEFYFD